MMKSSKQTDLLNLIDGILQEETEFRINIKLLQIDDNPLYEIHRECEHKFRYDPKHEKLRKKHEQVFVKYHQFIKQHKLLVKYCVSILDQIKSNCYNHTKYLEDKHMLSAGLRKTKDDHSEILGELKIVKQEHNEYLIPVEKEQVNKSKE